MEESEQHRLNNLLIAAIKASDTETVISLLQQGADPNAEAEVDLYGFSIQTMPVLLLALSWWERSEAAKSWMAGGPEEKINVPLVKVLVDAGANVNATGTGDCTPLNHAATFDEREVAEYLLDHGADIHQTSYLDQTPLFTACETRSLSVVQLLLERGADVNKVTRGTTPLQFLEQPDRFRRNRTMTSKPRKRTLSETEKKIIQLLVSYGAREERL